MRPSDLRMPGAVDLSTLKRPPAPPAPTPAPAAASGGSGVVVAVTEATFEAEVVTRSSTVPVVLDFWAQWCGPCKQLSPVLEALAVEYGGRFVLATVDVDAEQRLGQAFQIQSIPTVLAVIAGQPVPLFQGAMPAEQVRQVIDELLRVAAANGVTGTVEVTASADADEPPPIDPLRAQADAALERGDLPAALDATRQLAERDPSDADAAVSAARLELLVRVEGREDSEVLAAAQRDPHDLAAALAAADLEMANGEVEQAVARLVDLVRRSTDDDRDTARTHLIGLLAVLDPEDPRLAAGRRALANALF